MVVAQYRTISKLEGLLKGILIKPILNMIKEDRYGKKSIEEENEEVHEYGETPKNCPGGWKNCPGTDSDGEIFPDHYAVSDGGPEDH